MRLNYAQQIFEMEVHNDVNEEFKFRSAVFVQIPFLKDA